MFPLICRIVPKGQSLEVLSNSGVLMPAPFDIHSQVSRSCGLTEIICELMFIDAHMCWMYLFSKGLRTTALNYCKDLFFLILHFFWKVRCIFKVTVHASVCVRMYTCTCTWGAYTHVHMESREGLQVSCLITLDLIPLREPLAEPGHQAGSLVQGSFFCSHGTLATGSFFCGYWEFKLRTSHLPTKGSYLLRPLPSPDISFENASWNIKISIN